MKATGLKITGCVVAVVLAVCITPMISAEKTSTQTSQAQDELRKALAKSYQSEKSGAYEDAIKDLAKVLKANTQNYVLNLRIGWLYYMRGEYDNSKMYYQNAIRISPDSVEARTGCMLPLIALERYSDADALAKQVLSDDPGNYYANIRYSYSLRFQQKFEQALKIATKMHQMYPSDSTVLKELAMAKWGMNDIDGAKAAFNEVLNISQDDEFAKAMLKSLEDAKNPGKGGKEKSSSGLLHI